MFYEISLYYSQYQWLVHYVHFIENIYFLSSPGNLTRKPLLRRSIKWQLFGALIIMIVVKIIKKIKLTKTLLVAISLDNTGSCFVIYGRYVRFCIKYRGYVEFMELSEKCRNSVNEKNDGQYFYLFFK